MIRRYVVPLKAALMLIDGVSAMLLFLLLVNFRIEALEGTWSLGRVRPLEVSVAYGVLWVGAMWFMGLYRLRTHWTLRRELVDVLRAAVLLLVASLSVLYIFNLTNVSRLLLGMLLLAQPAVTVSGRVALRLLLERLRRQGRLRREMLIVGAGRDAEAFAANVERQRELGLRVMGHLRGPREQETAVSRAVLGGLDDIEQVLGEHVVDEVAICLAPEDWAYVEPATRICQELGKIARVSIQPLRGVLTGGMFEDVGGVPIVTFLYGPDRFVGMLAKRSLDIVASSLLLVLFSPVMLLVALDIWIRDGRPVFFRQPRVGLHGRVFSCLKFRTMVPDADERIAEVAHLNEVSGPAFKISNDPRVTRSGRFLRQTSLDELPQLWNVLRGEMSIVGPRPAPPREVEVYSLWHRRRLAMRPGLTGLWQVSARDVLDFDRRVALDLDYIDRWSLWMDIKIMLRTIPAMLGQEGS